MSWKSPFELKKKMKQKIKKNLSAPKIKEIEKNLLELEKNLFKSKNYYDYDDIEYKGIRNIRNLFDLSINENYHKPIITDSAFNNNYFQHEIMGGREGVGVKTKTKIYQLKNHI